MSPHHIHPGLSGGDGWRGIIHQRGFWIISVILKNELKLRCRPVKKTICELSKHFDLITHKRTQAFSHTHSPTPPHTRARTHKQSYTYTLTHTLSHTLKHTHTHTPLLSMPILNLIQDSRRHPSAMPFHTTELLSRYSSTLHSMHASGINIPFSSRVDFTEWSQCVCVCVWPKKPRKHIFCWRELGNVWIHSSRSTWLEAAAVALTPVNDQSPATGRSPAGVLPMTSRVRSLSTYSKHCAPMFPLCYFVWN